MNDREVASLQFNVAASGEKLDSILLRLNSTCPVRESKDGTRWFHFWLESNKSFQEIQDILKSEKASYFLSDKTGNRDSTRGFPQWIREVSLRTSTTLTFQFDFKSSVDCAAAKGKLEQFMHRLIGSEGLIRWEIWNCPVGVEIRTISGKGQAQGEKISKRSGEEVFSELMRYIAAWATDVNLHIWFDRSEEHA